MRVIGAARELAIDRDQVLHRRNLGRQDDAVLRARPISSARAADSSADCTIASRVTARASFGFGATRVLVHQLRQQFLIERAPVGADAHRLAVLDRHLDDVRRTACRACS